MGEPAPTRTLAEIVTVSPNRTHVRWSRPSPPAAVFDRFVRRPGDERAAYRGSWTVTDADEERAMVEGLRAGGFEVVGVGATKADAPRLEGET